MNGRLKSVAMTGAAAAVFGFAGATTAIFVFHDSIKGDVGPAGSAGPAGPPGPVGDSAELAQHISALEAKVGDGHIGGSIFGCTSGTFGNGVEVVTGVDLIPTGAPMNPYLLDVQRSTICLN